MVWFFNSARSAPSALVLEFNIHPSDLRLHLAAGSHVSTGNTATVLFFVIEGFLPYGGGYGEFAMFQICLQGAMSAFLDNTAVLGRQVANIFYIFLSGFTSFIISYPRKTVWGKHQVKKIKSTKEIMPLPRAAPSWGAHVSGSNLAELRGGCMFTSHHKKVPSWNSRDDVWGFFLCESGAIPGDVHGRWIFQKHFIAATSVRQKQSGSIYIGGKGRKSAQLMLGARTPKLRSRSGVWYLVLFNIGKCLIYCRQIHS